MKYIKINHIAYCRLVMTVECSKCGKELSGHENFCPNCGKKLQHKEKYIPEETILAILNSQEELNKKEGEENLPSSSGTAEMPTKETNDSKDSIFVGDVKVGGDSVSANPSDSQDVSVGDTSDSKKAALKEGAPRCLLSGLICEASCPDRSPKGAYMAMICPSIPPKYHMCPKWGSGFVDCSEA